MAMVFIKDNKGYNYNSGIILSFYSIFTVATSKLYISMDVFNTVIEITSKKVPVLTFT